MGGAIILEVGAPKCLRNVTIYNVLLVCEDIFECFSRSWNVLFIQELLKFI